MKIFINDVAVKRNSGGVYTVIQSVYSSAVKMNDDHFTFLGADVKIMDSFFSAPQGAATPKNFQNPDFSLKWRDFWVFL